jgi:putative endopeptidase
MSKVRIQDDLYNYVNEKTLEQLIIPDDKPCAGGFMVLSDDVEKTMMDEFEQMCKSSSYPNDYLKRACMLYKIAMDTKKKDEFGITPVLKNLKVLDELNSKDDLNKLFKTFMLKGLPLPFKVMVETDMKNTKKHCVCLQGPSVILPDASYHKPQMAAQKEMILGIWTNIAKMIIAKTDLSLEEQEEYLADTLAFDAILGGLVKTSEEWSDYVLMYNPMETNKVSTMLNTVDFEYILNDLFNFVPDTVILFEPRYI